MRIYLWLVLFLVLSISPGYAQTTTIAVITDLSGPMASWGQQTQAGARLALKELQTAGEDVDIEFGDHQLQAKSAVSEIARILALTEVRGVFMEFTPTTIAAAPLLVQRGTPLIYSAAAASPLSLGDRIFKSYMNYVDGCALVARELKLRGIMKPALLKSINEFGELCLEGLRTVFPEPMIFEYSTGDDVRTQVMNLKNNHADWVINPAFIPDFSRMLKAMTDLRFYPLVSSNHDAVDPTELSRYPDLAAKVITFALPEVPSALVDRCITEGFCRDRRQQSAIMIGYLHSKQLLRAARICAKNGSPSDSECITKALLASPADPSLGFLGWHARQAQFNLHLVEGNRE